MLKSKQASFDSTTSSVAGKTKMAHTFHDNLIKISYRTAFAHNMQSVLAGNLLKKLRGTEGSL